MILIVVLTIQKNTIINYIYFNRYIFHIIVKDMLKSTSTPNLIIIIKNIINTSLKL